VKLMKCFRPFAVGCYLRLSKSILYLPFSSIDFELMLFSVSYLMYNNIKISKIIIF